MDRYKFQNSKFTSFEDGRQLRVMQKKQEQRASRNMSYAKNRVMDTPGPMESIMEATPCPSTSLRKYTTGRHTKRYTPKELEDLGKLRYQKMLLWKEQRQRKKNNERRSKRPVFHTGVYHPDQAKFLCTGEESEVDAGNSFNKTPWRSVSKSQIKSSVKIQLKSTPAMHKPKMLPKSLQFPTRVSTPHNSKSTNVTISTRVQRHFRPPPTAIDLGVDYPKQTLGNQRQTLARKMAASGQKITSFAPKNFSFNFPPVSVEASNSKLEIKSEKVGPTRINESDESPHNVSEESPHSVHLMELSVAVTKLPTSGGKLTQKSEFASPRENLITTQSSVIIETDKKNEPNHSCEGAENMNMVETVEKNENVDSNFQQNTTNSDVPITISHNTDSSEPVELPEKIKRRKIRKSIQKILISPPTSKLRPRTPCSRSTRRSKSAHGNRLSLGSCQSVSVDAKSLSKPGRKRRSSKKSCNTPNIGTEVQDENISNIQQQQELFQSPLLKNLHSSPTVKLVEIKSIVAQNLSIFSPIDTNTLQVSVTRSPLSPDSHSATKLTKRRTKSCSPISKLDSSMCKQETPEKLLEKREALSSVRRRRLAKPQTPLEKMFNDIPVGSPVSLEILDDSVSTPGVETPANPDDTLSDADVEMMAALQPSFNEPILTPEINAWGNGDDKMEPTKVTWSNSSPVVIFPKATSQKTVKTPVSIMKKVRRKRSSVKFPVTPIPTKAVTTNDESNVILVPGLSPLDQQNEAKSKPTEDLISFNTPTRGKRGRKSRSSRISLLPGLHSVAEKTDELRVENNHSHNVHGAEGIQSQDLISFSPVISVKKKKGRRSSTASATPRRSTRLVQ